MYIVNIIIFITVEETVDFQLAYANRMIMLKGTEKCLT